MGLLDGKVAFITGAARGQGRSHAVRLAEAGADIIAVDICSQLATVPYPLATEADLAETVRLVEGTGRRIVARVGDVRSRPSLEAAFADGVAALGRIDIVLANAGIAPMATPSDDPMAGWNEVVAVNLTGAWNTVAVALPRMVEQGDGGSIVFTSSTAGLKGIGGPEAAANAYVASKHGLVGLMRNLANTYASASIRVNTVHPTGVATPMVINEMMDQFLADASLVASMANPMPVELIDVNDVSDAILWLVSDQARYVTGVALPVDAGFTNKV